ncbi:single-stranded DNA-binding protein [Streptacidiphilus sp. PB12-B1b]|uniref:single-stranded DNA-binding protein n=1 Tax=Streptacidiphilus sp. PB12-B1b TaxID=2705012 RepID=UPI0015FAA7A8|nr:single-stranded DNA-binding protein [Streptacidiphilus sp. PB12-B1b]QMU75469.1 single-stranded DNA-binding protein [Streptacidiphilus sp. PB12-B1b]
MNGTMVTLVGNVVSEVKYSTTIGGVPVANFRLAATDRRFDRQRQCWVDGDTSLFVVWSWRWLAENVLGSVGRGDPLLVTGRLRIREWESGEGRPKGLVPEIEAAAIGHDLCRGTSAFRRAVRGRPELVAALATRTAPAQRDSLPAPTGPAATGPASATAPADMPADMPAAVPVGAGAGVAAGVAGD